jgi:hypothetical protein
MMIATYFTVTKAMMVQNTRETTPSTLSGSTGIACWPPKVSLIA